jgi:hypothetical protein
VTFEIDPSIIRRVADMHAVYRMFDQERRLLYIGRTGSAGQRFGAHSMRRWFPIVASIELEWHQTLAAAVLAERRAIKNEHPRYNVAETPKWNRPVTPSLFRAPPARMPAARKRPRKLTPDPLQMRERLLILLKAPDGTTSSDAADALGVGKTKAHSLLGGLREEGLAHLVGKGPRAHWLLTEPATQGNQGGDGRASSA